MVGDGDVFGIGQIFDSEELFSLADTVGGECCGTRFFIDDIVAGNILVRFLAV